MRRRLLQLVSFVFCALFVHAGASTSPRLQPEPVPIPAATSTTILQGVVEDSAVVPEAVVSDSPPPTTRLRARGGTHKGYVTAKECVMWTENGGDYGRSSNPTHFGRFQFARSSWASFGGDPDTWGSASPEEQDAVFETAWSMGPKVQWQQWLRWDGCG